MDLPPVPYDILLISEDLEYDSVLAYVASGEVTALQHELRNDSMELAALVAEAFLTGAKCTEVLGSLRNLIVVQFKVDAALVLYSN